MRSGIPPEERPLDEILGRPTHVSILREVCRSPEPVWRSELPRRTDHSKSGVWLGIERLLASGLLVAREYWSAGLQITVEIDRAHPLAGVIEDLFAAEREVELENRAPDDAREEARRFRKYLAEVVARAREGG